MSAAWMIYGANGYTGKLIAQEAKRRGMTPVLAGRSASVAQLARELGFEHRVFDLSNAAAVRLALDGMQLVLHCAGPFSATCKPMLDGCLDVGVHYLDITGEIDVFAQCHAHGAQARERGILVMPGAGFDVVPTDCLSALLKQEMPDATHLVLAFEAGGGPSPGTAKTSVEGLGNGGRARIDGKMTRVPLAWKSRSFERPSTGSGQAMQSRTAMTIPWGDVYNAYVSTGIPNIEVYMAVSPKTIANVRRMRLLGPLLRMSFVQDFMKRRVEKNVRGPSDDKREATVTHVWGEVRNAAGREVKKRLVTPNGYALTVTASLGIVERLLGARSGSAASNDAGASVQAGYRTPSQLMGANYVLTLPGVALA
jgi:short subunit dehydrogenase-like uncharacterized protein